MKKLSSLLGILYLCYSGTGILLAQETSAASGGVATGSGGSVTYTAGQITYHAVTGTNGTASQGVQQPFEIYVETDIENAVASAFPYRLYPNPTGASVKLVNGSCEKADLRYRLYNSAGVMIQDKKLEADETEISMESLPPAVYFLRVTNNNLEVIVFKIVKR